MPQLRLIIAIICALDLARFHEHLGRRAVDALLKACQRVSIVSVGAGVGAAAVAVAVAAVATYRSRTLWSGGGVNFYVCEGVCM